MSLFKEVERTLNPPDPYGGNFWAAYCEDCHWQDSSMFLLIEKAGWDSEDYNVYCPRCMSDSIEEAYTWKAPFYKRLWYNLVWYLRSN